MLYFAFVALGGIPGHVERLEWDMIEATDENETFAVVVNEEEQFSIWPARQGLPLGWRPFGFRGTKQDCLAQIKVLWVDMRPLSLRIAMSREG